MENGPFWEKKTYNALTLATCPNISHNEKSIQMNLVHMSQLVSYLGKLTNWPIHGAPY